MEKTSASRVGVALPSKKKSPHSFSQRSNASILDIACGSGGPSLAFVAATSCVLTGIDVEPAGIARAASHAAALGLIKRANFKVVDCNAQLPFRDAKFDFVVCIDAILHIKDRFASMIDWCRILKPGGRLIFSDAAILTGAISKQELDIRASHGEFVFVAPGVNETAIARAKLRLLKLDDTTMEMATIARQLLVAREARMPDLKKEEGQTWFEQRQRFLTVTSQLAAEERLSRQFYVTEKPL